MWFKRRYKEKGFTQETLGKFLGVDRSMISRIISGAVSGEMYVPMLAEALDATEAEIRRRLGLSVTKSPSKSHADVDFSRKLPVEQGEKNLPVLKMPLRAVKVIGEVQAGIYRDALEWPPEDRYDIMAEIPLKAAKYEPFGLKVVGPSMNAIFPEGSIAICVRVMDMGEEFEIQGGTYVVVLRRNDHGPDEFEATIKQLERDKEGKVWLWPRSNHPSFQEPIPFPVDRRDPEFSDEAGADDVRVWAIVVAYHRPLPF